MLSFFILAFCHVNTRGCWVSKMVIPLYVLYFDLRPGSKILFQADAPEGSDTF